MKEYGCSSDAGDLLRVRFEGLEITLELEGCSTGGRCWAVAAVEMVVERVWTPAPSGTWAELLVADADVDGAEGGAEAVEIAAGWWSAGALTAEVEWATNASTWASEWVNCSAGADSSCGLLWKVPGGMLDRCSSNPEFRCFGTVLVLPTKSSIVNWADGFGKGLPFISGFCVLWLLADRAARAFETGAPEFGGPA